MSKTFIAEVKAISPFGFKSNYRMVDLQGMAVKYGDLKAVGVLSKNEYYHLREFWNGKS